ncbi:calcium-translocating P-type ATPase [Sarocladium strictum]
MASSSASATPSPGKETPVGSDAALATTTIDTNPKGKEPLGRVSIDLTDPDPIPANNFAFTPTQLHKLQSERTLEVLDAFGGIRGLAIGLRTDPVAGLNADEGNLDGGVSFNEAVAAGREDRTPIRRELSALPETHPSHGLRILERDDDKGFIDRIRIFGKNKLPKRQQKSFLKLMWIAFNDKLLILLTISATISLVIGIYQSLDAEEGTSNIEWVDGVTVVVAILVIVFASAATDWQKTHKFEKLNERKEQRDVLVVRSGCDRMISVYDVMVGDVMHLEAGDVVAVDGVLIQGSNLQVDESSLSGESELVHKVPADRLVHHKDLDANPFILSGTTVSRGVGRYLVTAVGASSQYGRMLMSLRTDIEETPLQAKLGRFGKQLITFGGIAGTIFFIILLIRWLVQMDHSSGRTPSETAEQFFEILILAVTVVVITVPEGLALNVTIALAFATKRMLKDNNLVRLIRSCEIMGNATTICSDKTGTLTQNKMTVVAGRIGLEGHFDDIDVSEDERIRPFANPLSTKIHTSGRLIASLSQEVRDLVRDSTALNSTAFESDDNNNEFVGMSTETALLKFAREHLGMGKLREERANTPIVSMLPFDSSRKWMGALIKLPNGKYRLFIKGAAEIVFEYCAYAISDPTYKLQTDRMSESMRGDYRQSIQEYAKKMLRPVVLGYKDFEASEVFSDPEEEPDNVNLEWLASGMILVGVFGIRDPLRPEVVDSVRQCQEAGVILRMVTGDNYETAKAIAVECGIFTAGGIAMDGKTFRKLSKDQLDAVIPRLQVLARSSPEDKLLLVTHLKGMGETVAVTGDGTNDALALKAADVGFAMGVQGTEVAKEAASIILLDDNFSSIVSALSWGRTVNDAVRKFIQFQFTINIAAGTLTIITELAGSAIFTVVQLLWLNLIQDIFASLGLATDKPSKDFLLRKPDPRNSSIVTITMWKMILLQAVYQLAVVFTLHYGDFQVFNPDRSAAYLRTLTFNTFIFMQTFNQHNCRRVDNNIGIWYQGVLRNPWFIGVQCVTIAGQFIIIFKGGEAFDTVPLSGQGWGWTMLFGGLTIPLGALIRQVPDVWVQHFFHMCYGIIMFVTWPLRKLFGPCFRRLQLHRTRRRERKKKDSETASQETQDTSDREEHEMSQMENMMMQAGRTLIQPMIIHPAHLQVGDDGEDLDISPEQRRALEKAARDQARREAEEAERIFDLPGLIAAARAGQDIGAHCIEVHPATMKKDPILMGQRTNTRVPPSQDPDILYFLTRLDEDSMGAREAADLRARRIKAAAKAPTMGKTKERNGLSWEAMVRSKRR